MFDLTNLKTGAASIALALAATVGTAQAAPSSNDAARAQERLSQQSANRAAPATGGLTAREACKSIATTNFTELPATGKGFASGGDLACEFTRVGQGYTVTRTYDLTNPGQAQQFNYSIQIAQRAEQNAQNVQGRRQEIEDRRNSPLQQGREIMRDIQGGAGLIRQGKGLFRQFGF